MVARSGRLLLPPPGGDVIGRRRVDTHILALRSLGAKVKYDRMFHFDAKSLKGADILLDEASVTATENAIMAAVKAKGVSTIRNAASEPHIQELCHFLNTWRKIQNIGSNTWSLRALTFFTEANSQWTRLSRVVSFSGAASLRRLIRIPRRIQHWICSAW